MLGKYFTKWPEDQPLEYAEKSQKSRLGKSLLGPKLDLVHELGLEIK